MKHATLALLTFFSAHLSFGQTISDITENSKEATAELIAIYDLNVFSYFNLSDYDTELKQAIFKKTSDYQTKLAELKILKTEMLKTTYYTQINDAFKHNYDIKRRGFEIDLGIIGGGGILSGRRAKSVNGFIFKALPSRQIPTVLLGQNVYYEKLFLSMTEATGLEIENDMENTALYFFFTPVRKEKFDLISDNVRIAVANKVSGKIYFDKSYAYQPPPPKK